MAILNFLGRESSCEHLFTASPMNSTCQKELGRRTLLQYWWNYMKMLHVAIGLQLDDLRSALGSMARKENADSFVDFSAI